MVDALRIRHELPSMHTGVIPSHEHADSVIKGRCLHVDMRATPKWRYKVFPSRSSRPRYLCISYVSHLAPRTHPLFDGRHVLRILNMSLIPRCRLPLVLLVLALVTVALASSGDRNPTFQHCLKGCDLTYCDPSQRPIAFYLRWFGWTCQDDCRYQCAHSFTDNIRQGSKWHQCERAPLSSQDRAHPQSTANGRSTASAPSRSRSRCSCRSATSLSTCRGWPT